jgi:hypothetical protein
MGGLKRSEKCAAIEVFLEDDEVNVQETASIDELSSFVYSHTVKW